MKRLFVRVVVGLFLVSGLAFGQEPKAAPEGVDALTEQLRKLQEKVDELERLADVEVTAPRIPGASEDRADPVTAALDRIELDASLSVAFGYNLAKPEIRQGANETRLVDSDHNTFGIPLARIGFGKSLSGLDEVDAGFRIDVMAGRLVKEAFSDDGLSSSFGSTIGVPQAYLSLQVPTGLGLVSVKAGREESYFGVEHFDPTKNVNFSLSHLATYSPRTLTGASVGLELASGLHYTQWVGNGWNKAIDNNDAKSTGGQLSLDLGTDLDLRFNWILGAERDDSQAKRWAVEAALDWKLLPSTLLKASLLYGQEAEGAIDGSTAKFGGFVVVARQGFFAQDGYDALSFAVRGSYLRDQGGALTGIDQTLAEITGTIEFRPIEFAALRVEYRHDWSSDDVFLGGEGSGPSRDEQDTVAIELSLNF